MSDAPRELREVLADVAEGMQGESHPSEENLVAYAEGRLEGRDTEAIQDHLAACAECADLLLDLEAFHEDADDASGSEPAPAPPPRPAWHRWAPIAAVLVAALGLYPLLGSEDALPEYSYELTGGVAAQRSGEGLRTFPPGSRLELLLRPADAFPDALDVRVWHRTAEGFGRLEVPYEIHETGVAVLSGRIGETIDLQPGDQELLVVIGRRRKVPDAAELDERLGEETMSRTDDWTVWRVTIRVEG